MLWHCGLLQSLLQTVKVQGNDISHKLQISRVSKSDEGLYECRVTRANYGEIVEYKAQAWLKVNVTARPRRPLPPPKKSSPLHLTDKKPRKSSSPLGQDSMSSDQRVASTSTSHTSNTAKHNPGSGKGRELHKEGTVEHKILMHRLFPLQALSLACNHLHVRRVCESPVLLGEGCLVDTESNETLTFAFSWYHRAVKGCCYWLWIKGSQQTRSELNVIERVHVQRHKVRASPGQMCQILMHESDLCNIRSMHSDHAAGFRVRSQWIKSWDPPIHLHLFHTHNIAV